MTMLKMPAFFTRLMELGCLSPEQIYASTDGFCAVNMSLADMLAQRGVFAVPGSDGRLLECRLFFDDWYLYAVAHGPDYVYSLFKMREQEYDAKAGLNADGDAPGVTIPFISLDISALLNCLLDPSFQHRQQFNQELNRVVARPGQRHDEVLKRYFIRTEAQGPYIIARLYTGYIASLALNGFVPVPERYAADYHKQGAKGRLPAFIEENNRAAGKTVCDHAKIYIADPLAPTKWERLAILATHAGNISYFSFAAEVQFHTKFLTWWTKVSLPGLGHSPYASAVRADMSIDDAEFTGPTPYYNPASRLVREQYNHHNNKYPE